MRGQRTVALLGAAVVALSLSGCMAGASDVPGSSAPPTSVGSEPPATPKPAPTIDADDPSTWVITSSGIGPLQLGSDFSETVDALPDAWTHDPAQCSWVAWVNDDDTTIWFAQDSDSAESPISTASVESTPADETAGSDDGPRTEDGLGLGSSKDDILTIHPDATEIPATIGDSVFIAVADAGVGTLFFEFAADSDAASSVTVTERAEPAYEMCG